MTGSIDPIGGDTLDKGPLTLDQFGIEQSVRYAHDQAAHESKYVQDTGFVSAQSKTTVSNAPYIPLLSSLLETTKRAQWARVDRPDQRESLTLFTSSSIPSLGTQEQRDLKEETVRVHLERLEARFTETGHSLPFTERKTLSGQIHAAKALLHAFQEIGELDRMTEAVRARCNQFQRG